MNMTALVIQSVQIKVDNHYPGMCAQDCEQFLRGPKIGHCVLCKCRLEPKGDGYARAEWCMANAREV